MKNRYWNKAVELISANERNIVTKSRVFARPAISVRVHSVTSAAGVSHPRLAFVRVHSDPSIWFSHIFQQSASESGKQLVGGWFCSGKDLISSFDESRNGNRLVGHKISLIKGYTSFSGRAKHEPSDGRNCVIAELCSARHSACLLALCGIAGPRRAVVCLIAI